MTIRIVIGPEDEVLSLPQAASELGVSRNALYTWALLGRIASRTIGGRTVIRRVDLDEFRAAHPNPRLKCARKQVSEPTTAGGR